MHNDDYNLMQNPLSQGDITANIRFNSNTLDIEEKAQFNRKNQLSPFSAINQYEEEGVTDGLRTNKSQYEGGGVTYAGTGYASTTGVAQGRTSTSGGGSGP